MGFYSSDVEAINSIPFGDVQLPIFLDDVACTGLESRLVDCPYDNNTADCSHSQDAGTRCHPSMFVVVCYDCCINMQVCSTITCFSSPTVPTSVSLNTPVTGTANSEEVKYYNLPFHSSGITFRLDVLQGSMDAYASYSIDAPNTQRGYNWTVQNATYDDVYFSPAPGGIVYVALQGIQSSNSFRVGAVPQDFTTTGECTSL